MFIERKINTSTDTVELWACEWENSVGGAAKKVYLNKIGDEQPLNSEAVASLTEAPAICWSYGRTLGNIAVYSQSLVGRFPENAGSDAELPCDFVNAGKFRHGADRWWCRTPCALSVGLIARNCVSVSICWYRSLCLIDTSKHTISAPRFQARG